jgi:CheY-like chemotaxis protein
VDLAVVIGAALDAVRPAAEAKRIRLEYVPSGVGPVSGDPERLQQVVWNLLSNSMKFTPSGGSVEVTLDRAEDQARITVKDSGMGIPPEFLPHVFDRFRQADSSSSRKYRGLGLGLAIVRHLTELHGGTVGAASPGDGQGSTFTIQIPLLIASRTGAAGEEPADPQGSAAREVRETAGADLQGLKVLVVDDEEDARFLTASVLRRRGALVTAASSAAEAMVALEASPYDLLVCDIGMPEEDGYSLIGKVRGRGISTPAAALTAFAGSSDHERALEAGFNEHVPKPVEPTALAAVAARLTGRGAPLH